MCKIRDPRQLGLLLRIQEFLAEGGRQSSRFAVTFPSESTMFDGKLGRIALVSRIGGRSHCKVSLRSVPSKISKHYFSAICIIRGSAADRILELIEDISRRAMGTSRGLRELRGCRLASCPLGLTSASA